MRLVRWGGRWLPLDRLALWRRSEQTVVGRWGQHDRAATLVLVFSGGPACPERGVPGRPFEVVLTSTRGRAARRVRRLLRWEARSGPTAG